jgi:hypothetical protein
MPIVYEDLDLPAGATPQVAVDVRLAGNGGRPIVGKVISTGKTVYGTEHLTIGQGIDEQGIWQLDLPSNADILPAGTTWRVDRYGTCDASTSYLSVPVTGGPYLTFDLEADPLNDIAPGALASHAADGTLHGGGVELDYADITSSVIVTGSAFAAAAVPGLQVDVPDLNWPVYVEGHLPALQTSGGPAEQSWGIFPASSVSVFSALDAVTPPGLNVTTTRLALPFVRLPPHSAGSYVIGGQGTSGNFTARLNPSVLNRASLRVVRA